MARLKINSIQPFFCMPVASSFIDILSFDSLVPSCLLFSDAKNHSFEGQNKDGLDNVKNKNVLFFSI